MEWIGSRLGQGLWETYNNDIQNTPIRISHNLKLSEYQQVFSVKFRNIETQQEVLGGSNYYFSGESGPKFYITNFSANDFVIELRPQLDDNVYEYIIELKEETADREVTVSTGGSSDSLGFDISYRFNFGDGTITDWNEENSASHLYEDAGTYLIRSQASTGSLYSYWSDPLTVTVYDEPVVVPAPPVLSGDLDVQLGLMSTYQMSGSPILNGTMEYRVDWKDGNISDWTQYNSFSHTWAEEGTYNIICQARTSIGYQQVSNWSQSLTVEVKSQYDLLREIAIAEAEASVIDISIQTTGTPVCEPFTVIYRNTAITVPIPRLLQGESVEYKVNYGNGIITGYQSSNVFNYTYSFYGNYQITARLRKSVLVDYTYQWIEWDWSTTATIEVKDRIITTPTAPVTSDGFTEINCRRKGTVTNLPEGELYFSNTSKKWVCDYITCPGVGSYWVSHALGEYPYMIFIDFDLEGNSEVISTAERLITDGNSSCFTANIKRQVAGLIPVTFHQCKEKDVPNSVGVSESQIVSRYKILVRS